MPYPLKNDYTFPQIAFESPRVDDFSLLFEIFTFLPKQKQRKAYNLQEMITEES